MLSAVCKPCLPSSWLQHCFVRLHLHSPLRSDIKPDDLLLKGSKTKEKGKEKKSSKDKKKGQAVDGTEKRPVKAKVDELMVSVLFTLSQRNEPAHTNVHRHTLCLVTYAGVQQGAGEWVWKLWGLASHFQPLQRKSWGRWRTRSGWWQNCRKIQGGSKNKYIPAHESWQKIWVCLICNLFVFLWLRDPYVCTSFPCQRRSRERQDLILTWACSRAFLITIQSTSSSVCMWSGYVTSSPFKSILQFKLSFSLNLSCSVLFLHFRPQIFILLISTGRLIRTLSSSWASQRSRTKRTTSPNSSILYLASE